MRLQNIIENPQLSPYIADVCCENGICVTFDEGIPRDKYVIIKVDNFYNSLGLPDTPPSIDCLVIRECENGGFGITLIELKNITNGSAFDLDNMIGKFKTTINDFISNRFSFLDIDYCDVKLYFVSRQEIYKRDLGLKMEALMNERFSLGGVRTMIKPKMPDPTIARCYQRNM